MLPEKGSKKAESTNTFKRLNLRRKRSFLAVLAWLSLLLATLCGAGIEDAGAYTLTMSVSGSGNVSPGSMTFSDLPLTITATPDIRLGVFNVGGFWRKQLGECECL